MEKELCYWSVGDGVCGWMLQALVNSFHQVGMQEDFHLFSDLPVKGGNLHRIKNLETRGFLFKITFLEQVLQALDYSYFVYLDADTLFLRKPPPLIDLLQGSPIHFFLETDLTALPKNKVWWNCPVPELITLLRDCGVTSKQIYNLNSGCFILARSAIPLACGLALDFWNYALSKGYRFPDEPAWVYAMHLLCQQPELHLLRNTPTVWCSDWEGVFRGKLPEAKEWTFHDYMTGEGLQVNPAIIHALRSKEALIKLGGESLG